jgi:hypothetical protein
LNDDFMSILGMLSDAGNAYPPVNYATQCQTNSVDLGCHFQYLTLPSGHVLSVHNDCEISGLGRWGRRRFRRQILFKKIYSFYFLWETPNNNGKTHLLPANCKDCRIVLEEPVEVEAARILNGIANSVIVCSCPYRTNS